MLLLVIPGLCTGCGGTKLLREPQPLELTTPLTSVTDAAVTIDLLGVIVRDSPGTWARKADWDEYLFRVSNNSASPIELTSITLIDLMGLASQTNTDRKALVSQSKANIKRYRDSDMEITSGIGSGRVLAGSAAVAVVGASMAAAAAPAAILGGTATVGMAPAMIAGAVVLSPVFAVAGLKRLSNGRKVSAMMEERATDLPLRIASGEQQLVDVFFPLAPAPLQVEFIYNQAGAATTVMMPTEAALRGLHLNP